MKINKQQEDILILTSNNLRPFIAFLDSKNIDWQRIAEQCEIPIAAIDNGQWLPTKKAMWFLHKLELEYGYFLGIEAGNYFTVDLLSESLEKKLSACSNLGDAIYEIIFEMPKLNNHIAVWTEQHNGKWWLCHRGSYRVNIPGYEQAEWFRTLALIHICQRFLGSSWTPEYIQLSSVNSNRQYHLPKALMNCELQFSAQYGAIEIPLEAGFTSIDKQVLATKWNETVVKLIETYAVLPWFTVDWFSEMLVTTPRTLQRRLKVNGFNFRQLKEQSRQKKAKNLLLSSGLAIDEIALQCGYNDLSNFNRACKAWFGMTAPQFRHHNSKLSIE